MSDRWPSGARVACLITVALEGELGILAADPSAVTRQKSLSVGRYGTNRGAERLLTVLAERGLRSSWFLQARNAETHSRLTAEVIAAGHEIATSGLALEDFGTLSLADQHRCVVEARERIEQQHGVRAVGFRPGRGDAHPALADLLRADGFTWSSQLRGDDLPITLPCGLVELPHHHELDDAAYFAFNLDPALPAGSPRIAPVGDVFANWSIEFSAHRAEGLLFVLDLHPELIGTPSRAAMLGDLLDLIVDSWVATGDEIARWWLANNPAGPLPADHPIAVFERYVTEPR
ncbi:polysaccharide deacetylase family protein [Micropruina sp.]|uniref:polysaccharide deacetylase family protein n=1 Tax=Micropruina sp. TaxID=2737536 RepID=UPI0039E4E435